MHFPEIRFHPFCVSIITFLIGYTGSIEANKNKRPLAKLGGDIEFKADLTYFLEVNLEYTEKAELVAFPNKGNGSGDLANLTNNSAFIIPSKGA